MKGRDQILALISGQPAGYTPMSLRWKTGLPRRCMAALSLAACAASCGAVAAARVPIPVVKESDSVAYAQMSEDAVASIRLVRVTSSTVQLTIRPSSGYAIYLDRLRLRPLGRDLRIVHSTLQFPESSAQRPISQPFSLLLTITQNRVGERIGIQVNYQGCETIRGICLQPANRVA